MTKKGDKRPKFSISDRDEGVYHQRKIQKGKKGSLTINLAGPIVKKAGLKPQQPVYEGLDRNKNNKLRLIIELNPIEDLGGHEITRINNTDHAEIKPSGVPEK
jgi:hypothetical protein